MRFGRTRRYVAISVFLLAGQAWTLWSLRSSWVGHAPLTSHALVVASEWPGVVLSGVGALLVMLPRLTGMEDYHLTSVHTERALALGSWARVAIASLAASLLILLTCVGVGRAVGAFGQIKPGLVLLAVIWPQVGLLAGFATALVVPARLRLAALVVTPLAMFYALVGGAQLAPGAITELSPINTAVLPEASETAFTSWTRVAFWTLVLLTLACAVWIPRLRFWSALLASASLTTAIFTLPQAMTSLPGATHISCTGVETRVCWYAWGASGSSTFTRAVDDMVQATPSALRPTIVLGAQLPDPALPQALAIGYPGGNSYLAPWPSDQLVRRAYVQSLVVRSCREGLSAPILTFRAYRAFGLDPNARPRPWDRTEQDLLLSATLEEADLQRALNVLDNDRFFGLLVEAQEDPTMCSWELPRWTAHAQ